MDKDKVTTVLGAGMAVATAINPVLGGVATSVLHGADWVQLAMAGMMALFGYFTNKK